MKSKCHGVTEAISRGQEQTLPLWERLTVQMHLLICQECRNFERNSTSLRNVMKHYGDHDDDVDAPAPWDEPSIAPARAQPAMPAPDAAPSTATPPETHQKASE